MTLAFYSIDNEKRFDNHSFDAWSDRPQTIKEMLSALSDEDLRMYDMDNVFDVRNFQEDFNDDIITLGWFCVVIND